MCVFPGDGVDYSAVVSSLTQLLVDESCRSLTGFQSLVQKEWLALGHPFCDRCCISHVYHSPCVLVCLTVAPPRFGLPSPGKESPSSPPRPAPVFLLFLDCCWQLQRQFPSSFQFSETYLTTLWDCVHNHVFDTFLFNCPRDRELAVTNVRYTYQWFCCGLLQPSHLYSIYPHS